MILTLNYRPKDYATLVALSRPQRADQPEALPWTMYDTISYPAAGSASLVLFSSTPASLTDFTLSNLPKGILETFQFFEFHREFLTIMSLLSLTTTSAVTGAANDVDTLHKTARGVRTFTVGQKNYGPVPIEFIGRAGGVVFGGVAEGTETAPARNIIQSGETVMNGGFPHNGSYVLAPQTQLTVTWTFNSTAISTNTNLRHSFMGIFHRRVS